MADNLEITAGSGTNIKTDDIGGVHYQQIKLVDGTLDATGVIAADVGVKANALRVAPANNITDATYIGDIKFGEALPAGTNGIGKLTANSGVDIGDVDVTSIIPLTGATNLGKARDVALGANDVGVMALAVRDDTLTTLTPADGDFAPLRVSSTGALHVTGAGGGTEYTEDVATANPIVGKAIVMERDDVIAGLTPVEGDWAAFRCSAEGALWTQDFNSDAALVLFGTIDSDTNNIKTAVELLDNAVDGNYLNVNLNLAGTDCVGGSGAQNAQTLRVILATDDPAVALLTTIDSDTNDIKVATEIMDDWDATHASAAPADGVCIMGAGYSAGLPTDIGADADAARICTDRYGRILRGIMPQNFQATMTSADAQAATPIKAKTADRKMYILSLVVSTDTAMNIQFQDDTGPTVLIEQLYLAANGGAHLTWPPEAPLVVNTNEDFDVIASTAGNISVTITGYLAP